MLNALRSKAMCLESQLPGIPLLIFLAAVYSLLRILKLYFPPPGNYPKRIPQLRGFSIINAVSFLNKRYSFLQLNQEMIGQDLYMFKAFQQKAVVLSGEQGRRAFFGEKGLHFELGQQSQNGPVPGGDVIRKLDEMDIQLVSIMNKQLLKIFHKDRLANAIPILVHNINRHMEAWGTAGKMDPFKDIYSIVVQMAICLSTCEELASNLRTVQHLGNLYLQQVTSITPMTLLFPWFPCSAKKQKERSAKGLYNILSHYVDLRREAKTPNLNPFDVLIADSDTNTAIVRFALFVMIVGVFNTTMISCWALIYLGGNNEWRNKVVAEVQNLIATYSNASRSKPIYQCFSTILLSAWEENMPIADVVIRETICLIKNGPALRYNLADNFQIGGNMIDKDTFVLYRREDVHLNVMCYSDPLTFDLSQFCAPREEDKQGNLLFLGWGASHHICTGTKTAKLKIKMLLALMLSSYEYQLVDGSSKPLKEPPQPNRDDTYESRRICEPCFFQYRNV
ncbi:hypothetical protein PILCRDRAFT_91791 [Piloderma croceum F 1598]|uniref:Cytochrome P450 n=1 Tax=Piloderma croceum (strain F 1598) TaxID=765440 RepID=A0A0C3F7Y4_PILCF|nr:hypothetical protein PILCRDRAFT_91791 [Piloderma croceum F 1598]